MTVAPIQSADDAPSHHIHPCPAQPRFKQDHLNPQEQLRARRGRLLRVSRARSPLTLRSCDCWIWTTAIIFGLDTDAHECIHDHQSCIRSRSIFNNTVQIGTSAYRPECVLLPRQWDPSHFTFLVPFRAILTSGFVMFLTRCCHCLLAVHRRGQRHNSGVRRNDAL